MCDPWLLQPVTDITLRQATRADGPAIATLFRRTFRAALPFIPTLHTPEGDREHFSTTVFDRCTVWVAESAGHVVGFTAWRTDELDHLYVDMDCLGQGIGSALLQKAMEAEPRLEAWAFQRNAAALAFYQAKGFRVIRETDGSNNEEKEPDVQLLWERG